MIRNITPYSYKITGHYNTPDRPTWFDYSFSKWIELPTWISTEELRSIAWALMAYYCEDYESLKMVRVHILNSDNTETCISIEGV